MTGGNQRHFLKNAVAETAISGINNAKHASATDLDSFSMFAVFFEVKPRTDGYQLYLETAKELRPLLDTITGFQSIERFNSTARAGWLLSLSFWRDEAALTEWRILERHHQAQQAGRDKMFEDYRIRVGQVFHDKEFGLPARTATRRTAYNDPALCSPAFITVLESSAKTILTDPGAERFESLYTDGKSVLLGGWTNEVAAPVYRDRVAALGDRLRIIEVERDYGMFDRHQAPQYYPGKA